MNLCFSECISLIFFLIKFQNLTAELDSVIQIGYNFSIIGIVFRLFKFLVIHVCIHQLLKIKLAINDEFVWAKFRNQSFVESTIFSSGGRGPDSLNKNNYLPPLAL